MEVETTNLVLSPHGVTELFAAYAKAQAEMGDVVKTAENDGFKRGGKATRYADLAAVIEAVRPALNANGLAVIQAPAFDGERVTVETWITHAAGGWMRTTLHLRPSKADPQGVGSGITYGRRYALLAVAGVAPEDDDGNAASGEGEGGRRFEQPRQSLAVTRFKTAVDMCRDRAELKAWQAQALGDPEFDGLSSEEHREVLDLYKVRWAAFAEPKPEPRSEPAARQTADEVFS